MLSNPHNLIVFTGHLATKPKLERYPDPPFKAIVFIFNIHRLPGYNGEPGILYDVARLKIVDPDIIDRARALDEGILIQAHCHYEYSPLRKNKEASAFIVDDFIYMGSVVHARNYFELREVTESGILDRRYKKGFIEKNVEILRFENKGRGD